MYQNLSLYLLPTEDDIFLLKEKRKEWSHIRDEYSDFSFIRKLCDKHIKSINIVLGYYGYGTQTYPKTFPLELYKYLDYYFFIVYNKD